MVVARAVVTYDVAPFTIVGGVPAKLIKVRFDEEILHKHRMILSNNGEKQ